MPTDSSWNVIDDEHAILWREYRFGRARATSMVFRGVDGLVVVSPDKDVPAREFDALAERGPVRALVANNSWHYLGQAQWRARFPDAESYCPPEALADLRRKAPSIDWQSLSTLALPAHAHWQETPGFTIGESIVTVESARGPVMYAGDVPANMQQLPPAPIKWLFTLTDSAPGFRLFWLAAQFSIDDKKLVRDELLARIDALPPTIVVPGHGVPVDSADVAEQARAQLRRL